MCVDRLYYKKTTVRDYILEVKCQSINAVYFLTNISIRFDIV